MKLLFLLTSLIFAASCAAGLPPTTAKGQAQAPITTFNFQFPASQATKTPTGTLIETGNKNILINPSFENSTATAGWVNSAGTAIPETSVVIDGLKSLKFTLSNEMLSLIQDSTLYASEFVNGVQGLASIKLKTSLGALTVCPRKAGVTLIGSNCVLVTASSAWKTYKVPFVLEGTSNGIALVSLVNQTGDVYVDDAFVGEDTIQAELNSLQSGLLGKANVDLSNIATVAIPSGQNLESVSIDQVTGLEVRTKTQSISPSGRIALVSGSAQGSFSSGGAQVISGTNTNATGATSATVMTGAVSVASGAIIAGTQGSTGVVSLQSGAIPAGVTGSSGTVNVFSGNNLGAGGSGPLFLQTGSVALGATGNTGGILLSSGPNSGTGTSGPLSFSSGTATSGNSGNASTTTGKSVNAASGNVSIATGGINSSAPSNATTGTATGNITLNSGDIGTGATASTAVTGNMTLRTGNNIGLGVSGNVNLQSGNSTSTTSVANTGTLNINSGNHSGLGASGNLNMGTGNTSNASNTASSGQIFIVSGSAAGTGATGDANLKSGNRTGTGSGTSGIVLIASGDITNAAATGASGFAQISSGTQAGLGASGNTNVGTGSITNASSSAQTGNINLFTGQTSGTGNTGNINLTTGTVTTGVRGTVNITAQTITVNNSKIESLGTPTSPQDAATKDYVDSQIVAQTDFHKQSITLNATNITNQYVDLSIVAVDESCQIGKNNRQMIWQGLDFSVSKTGGAGGNTRISFIGPSATGGADQLISGNTLYIQCVIE